MVFPLRYDQQPSLSTSLKEKKTIEQKRIEQKRQGKKKKEEKSRNPNGTNQDSGFRFEIFDEN